MKLDKNLSNYINPFKSGGLINPAVSITTSRKRLSAKFNRTSN